MAPRRPLKKPEPTFFPQMTNSEICDCLSFLLIPSSMEDVSKPNAQIVQTIYAALLDALMGASFEMIEGPKATLMGMMEYKVGPAFVWTCYKRKKEDLSLKMRC